MADPKDNDLELDNQETGNEGLETETDANDQDGQVDEDGAELEGSAEGDGTDAAGQQEEVDGAQRRPTRGEARFQTLSKTAREAKEDAARARQENEELKVRLARLEQPRQETRGKSPEELALMTPDELVSYRLGEATKGFEQKLGAIQWATYEQNDKAAYNALKREDPLAARYADEVERRLMAMRVQGQNVDRERLLTYVIGEKAREKSGAAKRQQQGEGQRRIARQTVKPGAQQRSDTQSNRGRVSDQEAREKRLENIVF